MENASKALIIAGAILISILLISVGVLIMNSMDPMKRAAGEQANSMAIQTFNAQFTSYEGQDKQASEIRSLFSTVQSSNASYENEVIIAGQKIEKDEKGNVTSVKAESTTDNIISVSSEIKSGDRYDVTLDYTNGYVSKVTVTKHGST